MSFLSRFEGAEAELKALFHKWHDEHHATIASAPAAAAVVEPVVEPVAEPTAEPVKETAKERIEDAIAEVKAEDAKPSGTEIR